MVVIFASNVKRSDTRNSLPIFYVLVIFCIFFEDANNTKKFPARELLAFYSIQWKAQEFHTETIYWLLFRSTTYWKHVNHSAQQGPYTHRIQTLNFQIKYVLVFNI